MQKIQIYLQKLIYWLRLNPKAALVVLVVLLLMSRWHHATTEPAHHTSIMTVDSHPLSSSLYYAGIIEPLKAIPVLSPAEGVIESMAFHYGDTVQPGQLLFIINSEKFETDYKNALVQYVKARSELSTNQNQLYQGDFLHKNKLISDDEYNIRKTNFYNAQLAFVQAKDVLGKTLQQLDLPGVNLYELSINDVDKINKALHIQTDKQKLRVIARSGGLVLSPVSHDSAGVEKKMGKGEEVKQGDVLAQIGDGHGVSVRIAVNEFDISQIQVGQRVRVTGAAFAGQVLTGTIAGVDHQAHANQNGIPSFSAEVVVPVLTPAQQKAIYIGMSAKVEVSVDDNAQIAVPLRAVMAKDGAAFVMVQNKNGKLQEQVVKTGKTSVDTVVIAEGLQAGDKIAITD